MSLIRKLMQKPWESPGYSDAHDGDVIGLPDKKVGLWAFIIVMAGFFGLFTVAYNMRIELATDWVAMPKPKLLWLNTLILILASIAFERAKGAAQKKQARRIKPALMAGGLLTIGFLAGQYVAWQEMLNTGYGLTGNPANSFFYLLTGLHGLHLVGGLWVWARTSLRVFRGYEVSLSVELCTTY